MPDAVFETMFGDRGETIVAPAAPPVGPGARAATVGGTDPRATARSARILEGPGGAARDRPTGSPRDRPPPTAARGCRTRPLRLRACSLRLRACSLRLRACPLRLRACPPWLRARPASLRARRPRHPPRPPCLRSTPPRRPPQLPRRRPRRPRCPARPPWLRASPSRRSPRPPRLQPRPPRPPRPNRCTRSSHRRRRQPRPTRRRDRRLTPHQRRRLPPRRRARSTRLRRDSTGPPAQSRLLGHQSLRRPPLRRAHRGATAARRQVRRPPPRQPPPTPSRQGRRFQGRDSGASLRRRPGRSCVARPTIRGRHAPCVSAWSVHPDQSPPRPRRRRHRPRRRHSDAAWQTPSGAVSVDLREARHMAPPARPPRPVTRRSPSWRSPGASLRRSSSRVQPPCQCPRAQSRPPLSVRRCLPTALRPSGWPGRRRDRRRSRRRSDRCQLLRRSRWDRPPARPGATRRPPPRLGQPTPQRRLERRQAPVTSRSCARRLPRR
jgi:hypothetical protein